MRVWSAFAAMCCGRPWGWAPPCGRIERLDDGRARIGMKRMWSDGTSGIELSPVELVLQTGSKACCDYLASSRQPGDLCRRARRQRRVAEGGRAESANINGGGPSRPRGVEAREARRPPSQSGGRSAGTTRMCRIASAGVRRGWVGLVAGDPRPVWTTDAATGGGARSPSNLAGDRRSAERTRTSRSRAPRRGPGGVAQHARGAGE